MSVLAGSRDVEYLYPQWRNILDKGHVIAAIRHIEALAAAAKSRQRRCTSCSGVCSRFPIY